jgi:hypothetical protein
MDGTLAIDTALKNEDMHPGVHELAGDGQTGRATADDRDIRLEQRAGRLGFQVLDPCSGPASRR